MNSGAAPHRHSTGVPGLDDELGGGLLPGTLAVVVGATGIGKTQMGLQFAHAGTAEERRRGVICDLSSRGDSQSHAEYAQRMFQWSLARADGTKQVDLSGFFDGARELADYFHVFDYSGRRVTQRDLEFEQWQEWQGELNAKLRSAIAFFYGNLTRGCRRVVVDGIEPSDRPQESIQFHLFEYIYHQILRKDPDWVARDLFREKFRENADDVAGHQYDNRGLSCLLLSTSHETMLDDLISRGIDEGDVLSNANTLVYMGKMRDGNRLSRGMYIAKHRGSACSEEILPYTIDERGVRVV